MEVWMLIAAAVAGYVGSIYSWPYLRLLWKGAEAEAMSLKLKAIAIENAIRGR